MQSFADMLAAARGRGPRTLAVAAAGDVDVLAAVAMADREGLCRALLVGDEATIRQAAGPAGLDLSRHEVVHAADDTAAAAAAVGLVARGEAQFLMKGMLQTSTLLKAVLDKERGLRGPRLLSHFAAFAVPAYPKLLSITDVAFNVAPDLKQKADILYSAVELMRNALGVEQPKVAVLSYVETVGADSPAGVDAAALSKMADRGQFGPCLVDGPLAMDLAVSAEAVHHKKVKSAVAGAADLLLVPDLNAGNILYKALVYLAGARVAGIVIGGRAPVVLISRADTPENKLYSIALGLLASAR